VRWKDCLRQRYAIGRRLIEKDLARRIEISDTDLVLKMQCKKRIAETDMEILSRHVRGIIWRGRRMRLDYSLRDLVRKIDRRLGKQSLTRMREVVGA